MKKRNLFIATLLVVAATTVAVVSCKKENQDTLLNNNAQPVKTFTPPQVDDMNAYLKEFKQKMKESQYAKDAEMLSLEEAAWHLSSVANYDFANANVEFTDLRYDTLYHQVNVANSQVSLSDLNNVYQDMAADIDRFYQGLDLKEKHFRFIGTSVSEDGQVRTTLITSYIILDHVWYFTDDWEASMACYEFFNPNTQYTWNTLAKDTLQYYINLLEARRYITPDQSYDDRVYYVSAANVLFDYESFIDPYGSPFYRNSRLYSVETDTWAVPTLDLNMMCYCLDSYLGLPFEYIETHPIFLNMRPVDWTINCKQLEFIDQHKWDIFCHEITVTYGLPIASGNIPIDY